MNHVGARRAGNMRKSRVNPCIYISSTGTYLCAQYCLRQTLKTRRSSVSPWPHQHVASDREMSYTKEGPKELLGAPGRALKVVNNAALLRTDTRDPSTRSADPTPIGDAIAVACNTLRLLVIQFSAPHERHHSSREVLSAPSPRAHTLPTWAYADPTPFTLTSTWLYCIRELSSGRTT